MSIENVRLRSSTLFEFKRGVRAADCLKNICEIFGDSILSKTNCYRWFLKFENEILTSEMSHAVDDQLNLRMTF